MKTDAKALQAAFENYAHTVSHDLSAPVRAMVEFSRILETEYADALDDEGKEYVSLIVDNGQRLQAMMEGLLQYSRVMLEADSAAKVDTAKIVSAHCKEIAKKSKDNPPVFDTGSLPVVTGNRQRLAQVLTELLDNAVKFQPPGQAAKISIAAEKKEGFWYFSVKDNGIGIDPRYYERIFMLFSRLHGDEDYPGVGMGLTLAEKIILRHGGKIWCDSAPGKGATFYFTLPAQVS